MAKRRKFSEREVVSIVARQLQIFGQQVGPHIALIACPLCGFPICPDREQFERDHIQALGLGGEDIPENCTFVHSSCHANKTHTEDRPIMHKADRQGLKKGQQARRKRRDKPSIPSRLMDGSKASAWKKPFNKPAERRHQESTTDG